MGRIEEIESDFDIFDGMTSTTNQVWMLDTIKMQQEAMEQSESDLISGKPKQALDAIRQALEQIRRD